jgi:hypothetical protein
MAPWPTVAKNESTVKRCGDAMLETLSLSLDARESHGRKAEHT